MTDPKVKLRPKKPLVDPTIVVSAIIGFLIAFVFAVFLMLIASQLTGYNLYTGDELESHRSERVQERLDEIPDY